MHFRGEAAGFTLVAMDKNLRRRLESTPFADLNAMMEGYAAAAVETARREFRHTLDYSPESIDALDEILVLVGESPERDIDFETRLWGSYLGEALRRRYAGLWEMTQYPGPQGDSQGGGQAAMPAAMPAVDVRGSRLFPLLKVHRRLTMGEEEDLGSFFSMVTERLGNPARVN
jgi:hypothetical protein